MGPAMAWEVKVKLGQGHTQRGRGAPVCHLLGPEIRLAL
jgi:hypothetical protein